MTNKLLCIALTAALAAASNANATEVPDGLKRLEAKWLGVMTKIRGWNAEAINQFREGYRDYPPAVLEKALAAETFEAMQATLDAHAGKRAQEAMQKAMKVYSMGATRPEDADNPQIAEAKSIVGKALGDDARDLVFIPITPCTVWDTRFATDPASAGIINNATTKRFYSHLDGAGGSFAAWGGNPTCPETAQNFIGVRPFAVMMTVYINDASAQGWLTLYRDGDPDPSFATISVYYSPGPTRTQTVISKSSRGYGTGTYDIAAVSRFGNTNASASITGYFVKVGDPGAFTGNISLPNSTATEGNIVKQGTRFLHNFGVENTFLGEAAGNFTTGGVRNVGVGRNALLGNTVGGNNTAVGNESLKVNAVGSDNVAVGHQAMLSNIVGDANTATGTFSMYSMQTGFGNTAHGAYSLETTSAGNSNTAVGFMALGSALGSGNIGLGSEAGYQLQLGDNNILVGYSYSSMTSESDTTRLGKLQTRAFVAGIRGSTTGVADAIPVVIDSAGQLGTISSSAAVKENVADMGSASNALMQLRPVTFDYREPQAGSRLQYGLIAEEVDKVYPGLVAKRVDGSAETVMYQFLPPMLLNEYQKQQRTIEAMQAQIDDLKRQLKEVRP